MHQRIMYNYNNEMYISIKMIIERSYNHLI